MLVPNLDNSTYGQLVLGGSLDQLPAKLADASRQAGSFSAWQRRRPRLVGQLPRRLIRADGFIDDLVDACEDHCRASKTAA